MRTLKYILLNLFIICTFSVSADSDSPYKDIPGYKGTKISDVTGYPWHGAVTFRDKVYGVHITNSSRGNINLVCFDTDPISGELTTYQSYGVTNGGVYQDAEAVVWGNGIFVFWKNNTNGDIYLKKFYYDENGQGKFDDAVKVCDKKTYLNFAVTTYKGYLCLLYHSRDDKKIHISYTTDAEAKDWKKNWGTMKNGSSDNIQIDGSSSISPAHAAGLKDCWDATNWMGKRNGVDSEMLVVTRVKSTKNVFEAYTYEGDFETDTKKDWNTYVSCGGAISESFYVKAIQAGIESFTDSNTNPIQIIYANQKSGVKGEVWIKEFYPETLSFPSNKHNFTSIPYGYYGVAVTNVLKEDHNNEAFPYLTYQQKLHIISANGPGYHYDNEYHTIMNSYVNRMQFDSYSNEDNGFFSEPALRSMIKLVGIVEGPPPTLVNSEDFFNTVYNYYGRGWSPTQLSINNSNSTISTDAFSTGLKVNPKAGPNTKEFTMQIGINYQMSSAISSETKITTSTGFNFESKSTKDIEAIALMMVPSIRKAKIHVYLNGIPNTAFPTRTEMDIVGQTMMAIPFSLSGNPSNIADPSNLECWANRPLLTNAPNLPANNKVIIGYTAGGPTVTQGISSSVTNTSSLTNKLEVQEVIKVPFFEYEEVGTFEWKSSNTTTFNKDLKVTIKEIRKELFPSTANSSYQLYLYLLTDGNNEITKRFYEKMKGVKIKVFNNDVDLFKDSDGTPFILAWEANSIFSSAHMSGIEDVDAEGCKVLTISGGVRVICPENTAVEVYSTTGVKVASAMVSIDEVINLPKGIYIVKLLNNGIHKVQKIKV